MPNLLPFVQKTAKIFCITVEMAQYPLKENIRCVPILSKLQSDHVATYAKGASAIITVAASSVQITGIFEEAPSALGCYGLETGHHRPNRGSTGPWGPQWSTSRRTTVASSPNTGATSTATTTRRTATTLLPTFTLGRLQWCQLISIWDPILLYSSSFASKQVLYSEHLIKQFYSDKQSIHSK